MAYQIVVKKRFTNKVHKILTYLEKEWSYKIAEEFLLIILNIYDTRMNPKKNPY
jgi:hypothetical protein